GERPGSRRWERGYLALSRKRAVSTRTLVARAVLRGSPVASAVRALSPREAGCTPDPRVLGRGGPAVAAVAGAAAGSSRAEPAPRGLRARPEARGDRACGDRACGDRAARSG